MYLVRLYMYVFSAFGPNSGAIPCSVVAAAMVQAATEEKTGKLGNSLLQSLSNRLDEKLATQL